MRTFTSLAQVEDAIESNDFVENHYLEAKDELKLDKVKDKVELTRDLAQFAFDGGTIVFGVHEDKSKSKSEDRFILSPIDIVGDEPERIEQIVAERACPPLRVRVTPIETQAGSRRGVVVVEVPQSTRVPHMVDGKYPIRVETTRRYLGDSEIRLWMSRAEKPRERVESVLDEHIEHDPCPAASAENAHVFGVAVPLMSRYDDLPLEHDLLNHLTEASNNFARSWSERFGRTDRRGRDSMRNLGLFRAFHRHPRSHETAMRSQGLHLFLSGMDDNIEERQFSEWSVDSRGGIRIYDAGFATPREAPSGAIEKRVPSIFSAEAAGLLVELAKISADRMGYHGEWGFGFAATGMRGVQLATGGSIYQPPIVDRDEMRTIAVVSGYELESDPGAILDLLAGPMLRMLGDEDFLRPF